MYSIISRVPKCAILHTETSSGPGHGTKTRLGEQVILVEATFAEKRNWFTVTTYKFKGACYTLPPFPRSPACRGVLNVASGPSRST